MLLSHTYHSGMSILCMYTYVQRSHEAPIHMAEVVMFIFVSVSSYRNLAYHSHLPKKANNCSIWTVASLLSVWSMEA